MARDAGIGSGIPASLWRITQFGECTDVSHHIKSTRFSERTVIFPVSNKLVSPFQHLKCVCAVEEVFFNNVPVYGVLQRWFLSNRRDFCSSFRVMIGFFIASKPKSLLAKMLRLPGWPTLGRFWVTPWFFCLRPLWFWDQSKPFYILVLIFALPQFDLGNQSTFPLFPCPGNAVSIVGPVNSIYNII